MSVSERIASYRRALLRENAAYEKLQNSSGRSRREAQKAFLRASNEVEEKGRRIPASRREQVQNDIIDAQEHLQDNGREPDRIHVINPDQAGAHNRAEMQELQAAMIEEHGGDRITYNLRPFDPQLGRQQTRTVVITVKGYYEVIHGDKVDKSEENHEKRHVFTIINFRSFSELEQWPKHLSYSWVRLRPWMVIADTKHSIRWSILSMIATLMQNYQSS